MDLKPRVTVKRATERRDPRLANESRLSALRELLTRPNLEVRLERVTRWAALGARVNSAFILWVLPSNLRPMALHGLNVDRMPRGLPKQLELVLPSNFTQTRVLADLEAISNLLGSGVVPGFFASAPIRLGANILGSLCVMDTQPRHLEAGTQQLLLELAASVTADLESSDATGSPLATNLAPLVPHPAPVTATPAPPEHLERNRVRSLGQQLPLMLFSLDASGVLRHLEGRLLTTLQLQPATYLGRNALDLYARHPAVIAAFTRALNGETLRTNLEWRGRLFHTWLTPATRDGEPDGLTGLALDVTDLQREAPTIQGRLEDIGGAVSLVQMLALTQPNGGLRLGGSAWLYLHEGRIVHVEHPNHQGERAVQVMLGYDKGSFLFDARATPPLHSLLLNPTTLALETTRLANEHRAAPHISSGLVALPNLHAAQEFMRSVGGSSQFTARMQTSPRWDGERLVLIGRGLTIVVMQGDLGAFDSIPSRGDTPPVQN
jgi:PAS domain-containing protein